MFLWLKIAKHGPSDLHQKGMKVNQFGFGKYAGKTFEEVAFENPGYLRWCVDEGMPDQWSAPQKDYFLEIVRRAGALGGYCSQCNECEPIRIELGRDIRTHRILGAELVCRCCRYPGYVRRETVEASLFVGSGYVSRPEWYIVRRDLKRHLFGDRRVTAGAMERFFYDDLNFREFTPGFFAQRVNGLRSTVRCITPLVES